MKTFILGIPSLKEAENSQLQPCYVSNEIVGKIVTYLGKRNCQIGDYLDIFVTFNGELLTEDRRVISEIVGDFAHLLFIVGDNSIFSDDDFSNYTVLTAQ